MIDAVSIFTRNGLVLWSVTLFDIDLDLIDSFIKNCLLEHRGSECSYSFKGYQFKWMNINRLNAYILVVYKGILESAYLEALLRGLKGKLLAQIPDENSIKPLDLSGDFTKILSKCDQTLLAPRVQVEGSAAKRPSPLSTKSKKGKEGRAWGVSDKASSKAIEALDYSKPSSSQKQTNVPGSAYLDESDEILSSEDSDIDVKQGLIGRFVSSIQKVTGNAQMTQSQIQPVLSNFMEELMAKNVARDVASKIIEGVGNSLVGTRTEKFTSIAVTIKEAITRSIEEILTPKKSIDVLKAALDAKANNRVYSICFLGVNGVGKSTNLAKVAYYLKTRGNLKILIAACDTFRSGAVEQLKTHATCLNVDLFEHGYGKDSAEIAKQALQYAKANNYDVCLIDTAGRMQDNEPLMRAIAKLVAVNTPDLVLFVGEALVGHDAVDQLTKFNRALIDYSYDPSNPRTIDGIVLTKYDTVDDKVGAALSMVYITGQPVVFVGTGQKYPNLKKLSVNEVVKALMGKSAK